MTPFTRYQKFMIAVLAFLQFTVILDFMIMSPLGALMMPALQITPAQFGMAVSVYAFSAGISGILASGFADRFDRKKFLLFFYVGFVVGTLFCGLAETYEFLLFARMVTGIFGGVVGSVGFAIITDLFTLETRGRVMGIIQTSFAASQILGLPIGIFLSNHFGWHAPFLMIVAISAVMGLVIFWKVQPIDQHLLLKVDRNAFHHFVATITNPRYVVAFAVTAMLSIGGFMIMPFSSAFTVHNLGISIDHLPLIYFVTGIFSIVIGPMIGRLSDKVGKYRVFVAGSIVSAITVVLYTHLGPATLLGVILVNILMFTGIFSRMIPSQALLSALPEPASRGSFSAVSSSLQQMAGGIASVLAGLIVIENSDGTIEHFDRVGWVMVGTAMVSIFLMSIVHRQVSEKPTGQPSPQNAP